MASIGLIVSVRENGGEPDRISTEIASPTNKERLIHPDAFARRQPRVGRLHSLAMELAAWRSPPRGSDLVLTATR